jgi:CDP-diacylglycerol--glycerol-3-phosphate 3-phosphatidyltransferase
MTTANKITVMRVLLVPFFIVEVLNYARGGEEWHRLLAILAFGVASISDAVDGYIARRYNQRSELGAILDPMADKILLVSGVVLLSLDNAPYLPRIPLWLTATILSRDALLLLGMAVIYYACGKVNVRPIFIGKAATVLQMVCVLWGLLKWNEQWLWFLALAATACTGTSGLFYVYDGIRQLSASPTSSPSPRQD